MSDHSHTSTTDQSSGGNGRTIAMLALILLGVAAVVIGGIWAPRSPAVILPAEKINIFGIKSFFGVPLVNTHTAMIIVDLLIVMLVLTIRRGAKTAATSAPSGWYNAWEAIIEYWWNQTSEVGGKYTKKIFYWVIAIFFVVWFANMSKLVPGYEAIGNFVEVHKAGLTGYDAQNLFGNVYALDGEGIRVTDDMLYHGDDHGAVETGGVLASAVLAEDTGKICEHLCEVIPWFRGLATDMNFTFALAIVVMVMVQVIGVQALGIGYFQKFINIPALSSPGMGKIDFAVGLLEIVSEVSKILSFSFRLFGNIFAGGLLLAIIGVLVPVILPGGIFLLETFVGSIQAYVFAILTLVFMAQATHAHH